MEAYEATRIVFSRIQNLDPENATKIMGLLLIQEHGEKEMIRLAFGPEALLHSIVFNARKDLGLLPASLSGPCAGAGIFSRENTPRILPASPSSWGAPPPTFSHSSIVNGAAADNLPTTDDIPAPPEDIIDEQPSFLNGGSSAIGAKGRELFYHEMAGDCRSLACGGEGFPMTILTGWGANGHDNHLRGSGADLCLGMDPSGGRFSWRPCHYFARGYCKNGNTCRFLHEPSPAVISGTSAGKMDNFLSDPFRCSPTTALPPSPSSSPSSKFMNFLLQRQTDNQRTTAAAGAALMLSGGAGGDEAYNFAGQPRVFAGISIPESRQIYLTFPADSTFREEDVSNYFSIYGPVQDVRIPHQQKRMFGFVTFVFPETVKLILAKGNPHFVCDARVLVKPYKEKGKVHALPLNCQRLDEQQKAAVLLQQAIELQGRRFQLLDLNTAGSFSSSSLAGAAALTSPATSSYCNGVGGNLLAVSPQKVNRAGDKEESIGQGSPKEDVNLQELQVFPVMVNYTCAPDISTEHNLPDSPFASPTKASSFSDHSAAATGVQLRPPVTAIPQVGRISAMTGPLTSFLKLEELTVDDDGFRFSSGHGSMGM